MIRVDGKPIYKKSRFKFFTVTCVSVSRVSRWHTSKIYKVAFKVRYTNYYEHFLSLFFQESAVKSSQMP